MTHRDEAAQRTSVHPMLITLVHISSDSMPLGNSHAGNGPGWRPFILLGNIGRRADLGTQIPWGAGPIPTMYPVAAMNRLLARRPQDAWAATISRQNG